MKNYFLLFILVVLSLISCSKSSESNSDKIVITVPSDTAGNNKETMKEFIEYFKTIRPDIELREFDYPQSPDDHRALLFQMLESKSSELDIFCVDNIWIGDMGDHLVDLYNYPEANELAGKMFSAILKNNIYKDKLAAMPLFADAPILLYRKDLLQKYGYSNPPQTYDELTEMAKKISDGEKAEGKNDFWGFVFQGNSYEGLTCNALEWINAYDGGTFVDSTGKVTVDNPQAAEALNTAASWIGTISPTGVTEYKEEDARQAFQSGNAAFMRNWTYVIALAGSEDSAVKNSFGVSVLPAGPSGKHSAALGGWNLAVNVNSKNQDAAVAVLVEMAGKWNQKNRALKSYLLPTYLELYDDKELEAVLPYLTTLRDVFLQSVARPSTVTAPNYGQVSQLISSSVHDVLLKNLKAEDALKKLSLDIENIMNR